MQSTHSHVTPINNMARVQAELAMVSGLARMALETLEAAPLGVTPPGTVSHALALIRERADILANDLDVQ